MNAPAPVKTLVEQYFCTALNCNVGEQRVKIARCLVGQSVSLLKNKLVLRVAERSRMSGDNSST